MRFNYSKENMDSRAVFANAMCQILVDKCNKNCMRASREVYMDVFIHFDSNVSNIYELIENQIPLFGYMKLIRNTTDDLDITPKEWDLALDRTKKACEQFYCS